MATFAMAFKNLNNLSADKLDKVIRGASFELFKNIVYDTPADSGRLKNSILISIDNPDNSQPDIKDTTGQTGINKGAEEIKKPLGKYIYIQTNLPYAKRIEFEQWSKIKAPKGMFRINILRMNQLIKKAIKW